MRFDWAGRVLVGLVLFCVLLLLGLVVFAVGAVSALVPVVY